MGRAVAAAGAGSAPPVTTPGFSVTLDNFSGPFDVLLTLIARKDLDITEVALAQVTDEFVSYVRDLSPEWDLEVTSEFLVVAATLLDLKAARLLPAGEVEDPDDLAVLEARDLLFARLLQYRAYRDVSAVLAARLAAEAERHPRVVPLEEPFARLLPEVVMAVGPIELAALAARVLAPRPVPTVSLDHVHAAPVSVREEAEKVIERLRRVHVATFRALVADCPSRHHVVARFLGLLELYREGQVSFEQVSALGDLTVRWTGREAGGVDIHDEFDEEGSP